MYRMLIADDEAIERFAFRTVVSREFTEIEVVGEAVNGKEVVKMSGELKPDIVIMDIKMPGINGIEAARQIKSRLGYAHIIILTAYDNFNYIQEALKLGVDDYLLKPSKKERIIQVLKNTIDAIEKERKKREQDEELAQKVREVHPLIENQLISSMLFGKVSKTEVQSCLKFLDIDFEQGFVSILKVGGHEDIHSAVYVGYQMVSRDIYDFIYPILHRKGKCSVSLPVSNNIILMTAVPGNMEEYRARVFSIEMVSEIQHLIRQKFNVNTFIGIGKVFDDIGEMDRSYREALEALKAASPAEDIRHFGDIKSGSPDTIEYPIEKERALIEAFKSGDMKKSSQLVDVVFSWMFNNMGCDLQFLRTYTVSLVWMVLRAVLENTPKSGKVSSIMYRDYYSEVQTVNDIWNLKKWFEEIVGEILSAAADTRTEKRSNIIGIAKGYIKENYMKEITLEKTAELVLLSPQHFSRLFKQETGINFVDYLTEVRMEKARELLSGTLMNVKEISFQVGYNDPNYFFKVFKKATDLTPGEYRARFLSGQGIV